jgi:hypothetical protein
MTYSYWKIIPRQFLMENHVHITVINIPTSEPLPDNDDIFTFTHGDGCCLSDFQDHSFHIAHSNSVIEHVGVWKNVLSFSKEIKRVAQTCYLQTPNYWFPIEPHYVWPFWHWLPQSVRIWIIQHFDIGASKKVKGYHDARIKIENVNLLTARQIKFLFPQGQLFKERFLFFAKSLIIIDHND